MKKKILITGSIFTSIAIILPLIFVISTFGTVKGGIAFFSNRPIPLSDGFNKATLEATEEYGDYMKRDQEYEQPNKKVGITATKAYDDSGKKYVEEIAKPYDNGYKTIISTGFQVASAFTGGVTTKAGNSHKWGGLFTDKNGKPVEKYKDKNIVLIDDTVLASKYTNAVSVEFLAEGAGFVAGIGAAIYTQYDAIEKNKSNPSYEPNIVMWGGMPFPTVYNFMSGFAQSITLANKIPNLLGIKDYKKITLWSGGDVEDKIISATNTYCENKAANNDASSWYTGGFDGTTNTPPGKLAKIKTENAIKENASIIFPVAGGNINVALQEVMNTHDTTTKFIGVDVDATIEFKKDNESEFFIGSATKDLKNSSKLALWAIDDRDANGISNIEENSPPTDEISKNGGENFLKYYNLPEEPFPEGWRKDAKDIQGFQFSGTINNDGVGFTLDNENNGKGNKGINIYLKEAINKLFPHTIDFKDSKIIENFNFLKGEFIKKANSTIKSTDRNFVEQNREQ